MCDLGARRASPGRDTDARQPTTDKVTRYVTFYSMSAFPTAELRTAAADRVRRGHPWVFKDGLARGLKVTPGAQVTLVTAHGEPIAEGLADPQSDLAVRVFGAPGTVIDGAFFAAKAQAAARARAAWGVRAVTDGWRLLHGENDGLPGFVTDVYGGLAVVKLDGPYERLLDALTRALREALPLTGILFRGEKPKVLWGDVPPTVVITEHGVRMEVDPHAGQKTGMFIDQRDNRAWVAAHAAGQRVLNLFSYTGGFSLAALAAGASHVTSVDIAAPALRTLERSLALNGFDAAVHQSAAEDCYDFLRRAAKQGRRWNLVVLDPPSLAHSKAAAANAAQAYERLNAAAMAVVESDGLLCTASCTSRVTSEAFRDIVAKAARKAGRRFQIIHEAGAGADHPVALQFPEGRYLKFLALQAV